MATKVSRYWKTFCRHYPLFEDSLVWFRNFLILTIKQRKHFILLISAIWSIKHWITATSYFAQLIAEGKLVPEKQEGVVSIHDAGALSRDLDETAPIRAITDALGLTVHEMYRHNDLAMASGGALMKQYDPALTAQTCDGRWYDVERIDSNCILTEAPGSYVALGIRVPEGYELKDYVLVLDGACK